MVIKKVLLLMAAVRSVEKFELFEFFVTKGRGRRGVGFYEHLMPIEL